MPSRTSVVVFRHLRIDAEGGDDSLTLSWTFRRSLPSLQTNAEREGTDRVFAKHLQIVYRHFRIPRVGLRRGPVVAVVLRLCRRFVRLSLGAQRL